MTTQTESRADLLAPFRQMLKTPDLRAALSAGLIGEGCEIITPFGAKSLLYADYTASGRALEQVEAFIRNAVLPYYANSHTEASYCGALMTRMRRAAREEIARCCGAGADHAVIFAGAGATAGINRLVTLWGAGSDTRVVLGPWEHHSNLLPWRESGAEIITLPEDPAGGPDRGALRAALAGAGDRKVICAFSAASNITGEIADVAGLTRIVKEAGAKILWDFAGGGPYMPIAMDQGEGAVIDAVVTSPHKFAGGPAASGVLILRRGSVESLRPSWPGGGTVRFVSPEGHDYAQSLEAREEGGTPDVLGDIRAALAFMVKEALLREGMEERNQTLVSRAFAAWAALPGLELLGALNRARLPIFSFRIRDGEGGFVHQQLLTRLLSDRFGIQARGGCACAGPYVHSLLEISPARSQALRAAILAGDEVEKPGFVRLNLSALMSEEKVSLILQAVAQLSKDAAEYVPLYSCDPARAIFSPGQESFPS